MMDNNFENYLNVFNEILAAHPKTNLECLTTSKSDETETSMNDRETNLNLKLTHRNLRYLKKVEHARNKILNGTFGYCEDCDSEITEKRLRVRPTASFCIHCQEEKEMKEKHVIKGSNVISLSSAAVDELKKQERNEAPIRRSVELIS